MQIGWSTGQTDLDPFQFGTEHARTRTRTEDGRCSRNYVALKCWLKLSCRISLEVETASQCVVSVQHCNFSLHQGRSIDLLAVLFINKHLFIHWLHDCKFGFDFYSLGYHFLKRKTLQKLIIKMCLIVLNHWSGYNDADTVFSSVIFIIASG